MGRKALEINPECGKRLKKWFKQSGYTEQEVADAIGYTPQHLSAVIRSNRRMTQELAESIASWADKKVSERISDENYCGIPSVRDMVIRAEWLLCKDDYMNEFEVIDEDNHNEEEYSELNDALIKLLKEGFWAKGYYLKFKEYTDDDPESSSLWPIYDEFYCELINRSSRETISVFPSVEYDQLIQQYKEYGKYLAESFINRFQPEIVNKVKEGYAKLDLRLKNDEAKSKENE